MSDRRTLLGPLVAAVFLVLALCGAGPAAAADGVTATATLDGKALSAANARNPISLDPSKVAQITVELTNGTGNPLTIRRVDLTGHVLGLNFFSYSTAVEMTIAAGKTEKLTYRLDPAGLDGQATGLIGADLTVIGSDGEPVAEVATTVDVRGSLMSVYGLFGIILAVLTALAIADAALTVARHRLSVNRWQRGLRLLAPGIGIGLMLGFTASAARWWVPATGLWLALAGATATVFFLAGYFSPTPDQGDGLDLDAADLAAARELDAHGYGTPAPVGAGRESDAFAPVGGRRQPDNFAPIGSAMGAPSFGPPSQRIRRGPEMGFPEPDRARPPHTPGSGTPAPFGPAVRGGAGAGEPHRPPGPGWHDPAEGPTVRVHPPRPGESEGRGESGPHRQVGARAYGAPESPGGTLRDIGGTLPDLPAPAGPPASNPDLTKRASENAETVGYSGPNASAPHPRPASGPHDDAETLGHAGAGNPERRTYPASDQRGGDDAETLGYAEPVAPQWRVAAASGESGASSPETVQFGAQRAGRPDGQGMPDARRRGASPEPLVRQESDRRGVDAAETIGPVESVMSKSAGAASAEPGDSSPETVQSGALNAGRVGGAEVRRPGGGESGGRDQSETLGRGESESDEWVPRPPGVGEAGHGVPRHPAGGAGR